MTSNLAGFCGVVDPVVTRLCDEERETECTLLFVPPSRPLVLGVSASRLLRHTPCGVEAVAGQGGLIAFPLLCHLLRMYMASYCYDLEGPSARWSCGLGVHGRYMAPSESRSGSPT